MLVKINKYILIYIKRYKLAINKHELTMNSAYIVWNVPWLTNAVKSFIIILW